MSKEVLFGVSDKEKNKKKRERAVVADEERPTLDKDERGTRKKLKAAKKRMEKFGEVKKTGQFTEDQLIPVFNTPDNVMPLTRKSYEKGLMVLGIVEEFIDDLRALVSLPFNQHGIVNIDEISDELSALLLAKVSGVGGSSDSNSDDDGVDDTPDISDVLQLGQRVPCVVLKEGVDGVSGRLAYLFSLSLRPALLNRHLTAGHVVPGAQLQAAVSGVEDYGYTLSLGIADWHAVLRAPAGLHLGQLCPVVVEEAFAEARRARVRLDDGTTPATAEAVDRFPAVRPGLLVETTSTVLLDDGAVCMFLGPLYGMLHRWHVRAGELHADLSQVLRAGARQKLRLRVLYVSISRLEIGLTALPMMLDPDDAAPRAAARAAADHIGMNFGWAFPSIVDKEKQPGVMMRLPVPLDDDDDDDHDDDDHGDDDHDGKDEGEGGAKRKKGKGKQQTMKSKKAKEAGDLRGASLRGFMTRRALSSCGLRLDGELRTAMRALSYSLADDWFNLSADAAVVRAAVAVPRMARLGAVLKCRLHAVNPSGWVLTLPGDMVRGFVTQAFAPPATLPMVLGHAYKARVLAVTADGRVLLSMHEGLMTAAPPLLTSRADARPGAVFEGVVTGVKAGLGVFVAFFGEVSGMVPMALLPPRALADVRLGELAKVKVARVVGDRLVLTFDLDAPLGSLPTTSAAAHPKPPARHAARPVEVGELVEVVVSASPFDKDKGPEKDSDDDEDDDKKEFPVVVVSDGAALGQRGVLPVLQLSDFPALSLALARALRVGERLRCAVFFSGAALVFTARPALLAAAAADGGGGGALMTTLRRHVPLHVIAHAHSPHGVLLRTWGNRTGLAHVSRVLPAPATAEDAHAAAPIGQTLVAVLLAEGDSADDGKDGKMMEKKMMKKKKMQKRLSFSLRFDDVCAVEGGAAAGAALLRQRFAQEASAVGSGASALLARVPPGSLHRATVMQRGSRGSLLAIDAHGLRVAAAAAGAVDPEVGAKARVRVLAVDALARVVEVEVLEKTQERAIRAAMEKRRSSKEEEDEEEEGATKTLHGARVALMRAEYAVLAADDGVAVAWMAGARPPAVPEALPTSPSGNAADPRRYVSWPAWAMGGGASSSSSSSSSLALGPADLPRLACGQEVSFSVLSLERLQLNVSLGRRLRGRVFRSELPAEFGAGGAEPAVGATLSGWFVGAVPNTAFAELTLLGRPRALALGGGGELRAGDPVEAVVLEVHNPQRQGKKMKLTHGKRMNEEDQEEEEEKEEGLSEDGDWEKPALRLAVRPGVIGGVVAVDATVDIVEAEDLARAFAPGQRVKAFVVRAPRAPGAAAVLSLLDAPLAAVDAAAGVRCVAQVARWMPQSALVYLPWRHRGTLHATDLADDFADFPMRQAPVGSLLECRVFPSSSFSLSSTSTSTNGGASGARTPRMLVVSCRASDVAEGNERAALHPTSLNRPLRSASDAPAGALVQGLVTSVNAAGVFVTLGRELSGRLQFRELRERPLKHVAETLPPGRALVMRVLGHRQDKLGRATLDLTLRPRRRPLACVRPGRVYEGVVCSVSARSAMVELEGFDALGRVALRDAADARVRPEEMEELFAVGDRVRVLAKKVDAEAKRLDLSLRRRELEKAELEHPELEEEEAEEQRDYLLTQLEDSEDSDVESSDVDSSDVVSSDVSMDEEEEDDDDDDEEEEEEEDDDEEMVMLKGGEEDIDADDDWKKMKDEFGVETYDDDDDDEDDDDDDDGDDDDDDEDDEEKEEEEEENEDEENDEYNILHHHDVANEWDMSLSSGSKKKKKKSMMEGEEEELKVEEQQLGKSKKVSKRERREQRQREEQRLAEMEQAVASMAPSSPEDFERLLVGMPNSSYLWIQFMAFWLEMGEAEKARAVGLRALERIDAEAEQERENMWSALLNWEASYGSTASLMGVFDEARLRSHSKRLHLLAARLLQDGGHAEEAKKVRRLARRRHPQSKKVWLAEAECIVAAGDTADARSQLKDLVRRAHEALPKPKRIPFLERVALLHFRDPARREAGRTFFETIIGMYPKRIDVYYVFIDAEVRCGNMPAARRLFSRILERVKLSDKKAKTLFSKWHKLEVEHGTSETVEAVKVAVKNFVQK